MKSGKRRSFMERYLHESTRVNMRCLHNKYGTQAILLVQKLVDPAHEVGPVMLECHAMLAALAKEERDLTEKANQAKLKTQ